MSGRVQLLKAAFDQTFATAPVLDRPEHEDLLLLKIAGTDFAVRFSEVARVVRGFQIAWLPSQAPALQGIVGIDRNVVPVFDLARLLDLTAPVAPGALLLATAAPVAFAVDSIVGHRRVAPNDIVPGGSSRTAPLREVLTSAALHLVDLSTAVHALRAYLAQGSTLTTGDTR